MNKELKKFMSAYKFGWKILTFVMIALIIAFVVSAIAGNKVNYVGLLIFVLILLLSLIPQYCSKKFHENLANDILINRIETDFQNAIPMRKDHVRFGDEWVFIKGKELLLKYEDIHQVYQYIHRTNFIENERALKYVNSKGKHRVLCKLALRGKSDEELKQMISIIYSKNPNVKIGYR